MVLNVLGKDGFVKCGFTVVHKSFIHEQLDVVMSEFFEENSSLIHFIIALLKDQLKPEIDDLLKLKASFKELTGSDYQAPGAKPKRSKDKKEKPVQQPKQQPQKQDDGKKTTRLGLEAKKEDALSDWYSQVSLINQLLLFSSCTYLSNKGTGCFIKNDASHFFLERSRQKILSCFVSPKFKFVSNDALGCRC